MFGSRMTRWLVPIALVFVACSRSGGPVEELRGTLEALGHPGFSPSRLGSQVYAILDETSRNAVDARAAALSQKLGSKVDPDEVLQLHGRSPVTWLCGAGLSAGGGLPLSRELWQRVQERSPHDKDAENPLHQRRVTARHVSHAFRHGVQPGQFAMEKAMMPCLNVISEGRHRQVGRIGLWH